MAKNTEKKEIRKIDVISVTKMYAIGTGIVGFFIGLFASIISITTDEITMESAIQFGFDTVASSPDCP